MATRIITFLGLGSPSKPNRYDDIVYRTVTGCRYGPTPMHDVPAIAEADGPVHLNVLGTDDVVGFWFDQEERFRHLLASGLGPHSVALPEITVHVIPRCRNESERWQLFQLVVDLLEPTCLGPETEVPTAQIVDVTHGFRSAPVLAVAALSFVHQDRVRRSGKGVSWPQLRVLYSEVPSGSTEGTVEDLSHVLEASRWNIAVSDLMSHGRADALAGLLMNSKATDLGTKARAFADGLVTGRAPDVVMHHAKALREVVKRFTRKQTLLPPIRAQLERLMDWLEPLSADDAISPGGVRASLALVERALYLQRFSEAVALLREALVDIWTLDRLTGTPIAILQPANRFKRRPDEPDPFKEQRRRMEDGLRVAHKQAELHRTAPALIPQLFGEIGDLRNDVEHCGYRSHPRAPKEIRDQIRNSLEKVRAAFELIGSHLTGANEVPTAQTCFTNCSNHPSATWTPEQTSAALALGHGPILDEPFPPVPPAADTEALQRLADETAARILSRPCAAAFVAGEHSLTFALVRRLQGAGIPCYVATTERVSTEAVQPDGSIKKTSHFRFVTWRRYPEL